jgi:5-methylcytosine-specific restriction endonuclease McrA
MPLRAWRLVADTRHMSLRRSRSVNVDDWGKPIRNELGKPICRWCRGAVVYPRRTFCSDACVHEWRIRSSPEYVREQVKKRDKGVCRLCGVNVVTSRRKWEADHIIPVADGGGECGLENYRLLCRPCHLRITLDWRASRARVKGLAPGQENEVNS